MGKVVGMIPGVGKVADKVLDGLSKAAGAISDKIHVKLGTKMQNAVKRMGKANKDMGYIPV